MSNIELAKIEVSRLLFNGKRITAFIPASGNEMGVLCAKFQIWARTQGLTDLESLACFNRGVISFLALELLTNHKEESDKGFKKLEGVDIPELSDFK
jgi:hypothetical protein